MVVEDSAKKEILKEEDTKDDGINTDNGELEALDALEKEASEFNKVRTVSQQSASLLILILSIRTPKLTESSKPSNSMRMGPQAANVPQSLLTRLSQIRGTRPSAGCPRIRYQSLLSQKVSPNPSGQDVQSSRSRCLRPTEESANRAHGRKATHPPGRMHCGRPYAAHARAQTHRRQP